MPKYLRFFIFCFIFLSLAVFSQTKRDVDQMLSFSYAPDSLLIRFQENTPDSVIQMIFEKMSVVHHKKLPMVPDLYSIKVKARSDIRYLLTWAQDNKEVMYVEPNYKRSLFKEPDDTYYLNASLWGLKKIQAPKAWDIDTKSTYIVGVIDTGVNYNHEDLKNNMWINEKELNGVAGVDDDHDGYIDDIYGYNFIDDHGDPMDDDEDNHGTHVAGTIGAIGNNSLGVTGVCWKVKIMALKFFDLEGNATIEAEINAIAYGVDKGAKILNMSYGGGFSQAEYDAIQRANFLKVACVAAAGNEGTNNDVFPFYPCSLDLPNIVSVAASDENDELADFSNYGVNTVDLMAPGVDIYSTVSGNLYGRLSGTSMAAPHISGCLALLWPRFANLSPAQIIGKLTRNVDIIPGTRGEMTKTGGRVNLGRAINDIEVHKPDFGKGSGGGCSSGYTQGNFDISYLLPYIILFFLLVWKRKK